MTGTWIRRAAVLLLGVLSCTGPGVAQEGEWRHYGGDLASSKYTPLDQITAENVADLEIVWHWRSVDARLTLPVPGGGTWTGPSSVVFDQLKKDNPKLWRNNLSPRITSLKATPLMVGGVLYLATPLYQGVAIDAGTGETLWIYDPRSYESGTPTMSLLWNQRGVGYWDNGLAGKELEARVYWGTGDGYLIAVDAATGRPVEEFGDHGRVDLSAGIERATRGERDYLNALLYSLSSPPLVVGDLVITGCSVADRRITKEAARGDVRAWDAKTGTLRWTFETIPRDGQFGVETWEGGSHLYTGNTNVWSMMSADEELGLVYLPIGTPTNDFYGGHRLGDNLFAESLVAVDLETGKRRWHFQTVHHGLWDYDLPAAPNLVDLVVDGEEIKAVAQISKQGFTYVLNRATGEPVWPIEEQPVPPSDMPGERAAATQPIPSRPPPFEYQGVRVDDVIAFTEELRQGALEILAQYRIGPIYTPPSLPGPDGKKATLMRPGVGGGGNWWGAAFDPEEQVLYVPSRNSLGAVEFYTPDPTEGGTVRYTHRSVGGPAGPQGLPLMGPPYSRLSAIDLNRGEIAWQTPTGNGDRYRKHEALAHLDLAPLGGDGMTGPLLTPGIVFLGEQPGGRGSGEPGRLVARSKSDGALLGHVDLPGTPIGTPMSYLHQGRQYVAVTVAARPPELVVVALPEP